HNNQNKRETTWPERSKRLQQRSQLPVSQLFVSPGVYSIIVFTLGFKTGCNPTAIVEGINNTWIKLPPFSSKVVMDDKKNGKAVWVPVSTRVEDHVVVPDLDYSNIENPDEFIEDYTSHLANNPMDMSRPLWEFHVLNIKTSNAESFGTGKFHHSLGNGMSLMSLLYASSRKTSDPDAFPTTATTRKHSRKVIHRIISLDDVKFVKNTMNVDIADMMTKGSKCRWGNFIGLVVFPLWIRCEDDPLKYIRRARATMDKKKISMEPLISYGILKLIMKIFGEKVVEAIAKRALIIHYVSYVDKLIINLAVDTAVIPDPHLLCDDLVESLNIIKLAALEKGLHKM
ncbi:hypothetical protein HID58_058653, partial [Brassica napus]